MKSRKRSIFSAVSGSIVSSPVASEPSMTAWIILDTHCRPGRPEPIERLLGNVVRGEHTGSQGVVHVVD